MCKCLSFLAHHTLMCFLFCRPELSRFVAHEGYCFVLGTMRDAWQRPSLTRGDNAGRLDRHDQSGFQVDLFLIPLEMDFVPVLGRLRRCPTSCCSLELLDGVRVFGSP